jgi:hypothetical protein
VDTFPGVPRTTLYFPQTFEKEVDLLFVIDNSTSMEQEQKNLADQFPLLIEGLRSPKLGGAGCSAPTAVPDRGSSSDHRSS